MKYTRPCIEIFSVKNMNHLLISSTESAYSGGVIHNASTDKDSNSPGVDGNVDTGKSGWQNEYGAKSSSDNNMWDSWIGDE